jgi:hypothetical protein
LTDLSHFFYHNSPNDVVRLVQSTAPEITVVGGGQALDRIIFNQNHTGNRFDSFALRDYLIEGQFRRISGTIFVQMPIRNTSGFGNFVILGDGVQLYRSPTILPDSTPMEFDVDISGVTALRIVFEYQNPSPTTGDRNSLQFGITGTQLAR